MSEYETLPIYAASYELLLRVTGLAVNFPKSLKYVLGEKIQNTALEMVLSIYRANTSKYKSSNLKLLINNTEKLYLFLRMAHDLKVLPREKFVDIIGMIDNVSRQARGWLKSVEKTSVSAQVKT